MLAEEFNLPVVPITIDGAYDVMPPTAKIPRPGHIKVTIHKPITAPEGGYDISSLIKESHDIIASALPDKNK
jgi:1-acyl-sn-glycerol-3-phosphate acyltransferase